MYQGLLLTFHIEFCLCSKVNAVFLSVLYDMTALFGGEKLPMPPWTVSRGCSSLAAARVTQ